MEASQSLNSKNQNIISKVQSAGSTSTVLKIAQVSPVIKIGSTVQTFQIEEVDTQNLTTVTTRNDNNRSERSGSFTLVTLGYYQIAAFFFCTVTWYELYHGLLDSTTTAERRPSHENNNSVGELDNSGGKKGGESLGKKMTDPDQLDIPVYLDSSDKEHWDQVKRDIFITKINTSLQENYLSEHNYEELLDLESAKTLLNFGDDYRNFIESNNSEVQSPRFLDVLRQKKCSAKTQVINRWSICLFDCVCAGADSRPVSVGIRLQ